MKLITIILALNSLLTVTAFAGQAQTECVAMKNQDERSNPKANFGQAQIKAKTKRGVVSQ